MNNPGLQLPSLPLVIHALRIALFCFGLSLASLSVASATTYYVDPATGSMSNPGTSPLPWSTLAAVFSANKKFAAGDVILCRTGYHGAPNIRNANTGDVTIQPDVGAAPTMSNILFNTAAAHWVLSGFDICPENAGAGTYLPGKNLVDIESPSAYITIENCHIRAVNSIAGYAIADWYNNVGPGNAIWVRTSNITIQNNLVENVGFGIVIYKGGNFAYIGHNTVTNFYNDCSRGLGDDCVWEYNTFENSYVQDANHDDFFQSWSVDSSNVVGNGTVYRNTLRGNLFISQTDPNQPLPTADTHGIGCFDGMYNGWVVENNVICSHTWHGISFYGAINCTIVNNTVIENPVVPIVSNNPTPWIHIFEHKPVNTTTPWPVTSSGNILRNNYAANGVGMDHTYDGVADHNFSGKTYTTYFVDWANFDFYPKSNSPLVGTGSALNAPTTDILLDPRGNPPTIGAYEYPPHTYAAWCLSNDLLGNNASPTAIIAHDGLNNLYKYALGLNPATNYNPGAVGVPYVFVQNGPGSTGNLALTFTGVATDVTYTVQAANDPTGPWNPIQTFLSGGTAPGPVTVPDTQSLALNPKRFLRLQMTNP
jgi:parallel beta-helix repeat protein